MLCGVCCVVFWKYVIRMNGFEYYAVKLKVTNNNFFVET